MTQADSVLSTPRTTAPDSSFTAPERALHEQLKAAGMRLERVDRDHYRLNWRNQTVARGLTLLGVARFIDRALSRGERS
jgi:hypothetical protein